MKTVNKIIACSSCIIFFMLLFPLIVIKFFPADFGMGLLMVLLFAIYPSVSIGIGIVVGTEMRKLWWLPLTISLLFPFLFAVAIAEIVWDLYFYSVLYFCCSSLAMVVTAVIKIIIKKLRRINNEEYRKKQGDGRSPLHSGNSYR